MSIEEERRCKEDLQVSPFCPFAQHIVLPLSPPPTFGADAVRSAIWNRDSHIGYTFFPLERTNRSETKMGLSLAWKASKRHYTGISGRFRFGNHWQQTDQLCAQQS